MKNATTVIVAIFFALGVILFFSSAFSPEEKGVHSNTSLSFSSTMKWGEQYLAYLERPFVFVTLEESRGEILLPSPPANDSQETKKELSLLLEYQKRRIDTQVQAIRDEVSSFIFAGRPWSEFKDAALFPRTSAFLGPATSDLGRIIFEKKKQYDRVRPHFLEPALQPAIEVPRHPAYPSGHATQAYFLAYIFSQLAPTREAEFFTRAEEIAVHREIAGVHYPSDSAAGKLLAEHVMAILLTDQRFNALLSDAKKEWQEVY